MPQEVTVREAARIAGCHPQWIHRLIYNGVLQARKIGPGVNDDKLVNVASIDRYIRQRDEKRERTGKAK